MKDTPQYITDIQREIIHSKTDEERSFMGAEMIDTIYELSKKRILEKEPELNKRELSARIFLRFYQNDFTDQQKERIVASIKNAQ